MNTKVLKTLIEQYDLETDLEARMRLANAMIDLIKKEVWQLLGQIHTTQQSKTNGELCSDKF